MFSNGKRESFGEQRGYNTAPMGPEAKKLMEQAVVYDKVAEGRLAQQEHIGFCGYACSLIMAVGFSTLSTVVGDVIWDAFADKANDVKPEDAAVIGAIGSVILILTCLPVQLLLPRCLKSLSASSKGLASSINEAESGAIRARV